jgi:hypothetical protein
MVMDSMMNDRVAKTEALVHFSGGADSTLCAAFLAEKHERIHLLTYDRVSFMGSNQTEPRFERLCRVYGRSRFVRKVVSIESLHRRICFDRYLSIAARFGLAVTALTFSKLAMHWYSCLYAIENGIHVVADGAVPYMDLYPDQNEDICLRQLRAFYGEFGVEYQNPVFSIAEQVEQMLYDKGITDQPIVRGTASDKQVTYAEQIVLALFLKYYLTTHGREKYIKVMSRLFADRLQLMKTSIRSRDVELVASV